MFWPLARAKFVACSVADRGWTIGRVFTDRPTTVRKGVDRRPGEAALLDAIRLGEGQKVLLWSINGVGRSLVEWVAFMEMCRAGDVSLWLDEQGIDTSSSNGMSLFDLNTMIAFHLRQSRRDRIAFSHSLSIRAGSEGREGPAVVGFREMCAPGCKARRDIGCLSVTVKEFWAVGAMSALGRRTPVCWDQRKRGWTSASVRLGALDVLMRWLGQRIRDRSR